MRLKYRPAAIADIQGTCNYIRDKLQNPKAAARLKAEILHNAALLKTHPYQGTPLKSRFEEINTEVRYLVVQKQMVFYEVNGEIVEIIRVLDGRTDYLAKLFV